METAAIAERQPGSPFVRGFILQITYSIERGQAVVELYGVLETGESFLIRDRRERPAFYVEEAQAEAAARLGARLGPPGEEEEGAPWHSMEGRLLRRVELGLPSEAPPLREKLTQAGVRCYESDVRFAMRYLMQRGLRASLAIATPFGKATAPSRRRAPGGIDRVFVDPELAPAHFRPKGLRVLSIDIETDPQHDRLLSIALYGCGAAEVLLCRPDPSPEARQLDAGLRDAVCLPNERALIQHFCQRVRELAPDVLTGWNFIDFDLRVLDKVARRVHARLELGRGREPMRLRPSRSPGGGLDAMVPGRVVVDGIQLMRGAFVTMESWSLGFVSRQVLGEGKLFEGHDRVGQILDAYENDPQLLVDYNLRDARLVLEILEKLHLIELAIERSLLTGLPIDRVAGSIAAFDFLYMSELARRRLVAPSIGQNDLSEDEVLNLGGYVLEPAPGLWRNVWVCDFKSLYPSVIRTFHIDPLGFLMAGRLEKEGEELMVAPNGARFSRQPRILPGLLDELFPRRDEAKRNGDKVASQAIKILMNSFYGVLGTSASRFHQPALAGAITAWGRELLLWSKALIESWGFRVLYGDTDSLFILSGEEDPQVAESRGRELVARLNVELGQHVERTYKVDSKLELQYEKLYTRLLLLSNRGPAGGGARKRYAGLLGQGEEARTEFTGLEAVRRDWTELAKDVQRELYDRLFRERDVQVYLRQIVKDLRAGLCDDKLVYRKALRKSLAEYTATTPPHVAAARKQSGKPGRLITYVITTAGAEPLAERKHPLDHEHYVQKQIRPIAEPVLGVLGLDFDFVVGDQVQLSLF